MKIVKAIATIILAQIIFLLAFGPWGLLAIPVLAVVAFGKVFWTAYNLEHLRLVAVEARAWADEAQARAWEAEADLRTHSWREFVATTENIPLN